MSFDDQVKALVPYSLEVPGHFQSIFQETSSFVEVAREAAETLSDHLRAASEKVVAMVENVSEMQTEVTAATGQLAANITSARESAQNVVNHCEMSIGEIREQIQVLESNFLGAADVLNAEREHCHTLRTRLESEFTEWQSEAVAQQQRVIRETDLAIKDFRELENTVDDSFDKCQSIVESLSQQLSNTMDVVEEAQKDARQACEAGFSEYENQVHDLVGTVLTQGANDLLNSTQQTVDGSLRKILDDAVEQMQDEVDEIISTITGADDETKSLREELQPLIDELKEQIEPLQQAIEKVKRFIDDIF